MTGPDFTNHPDPAVRALLFVAWYRTDPLGQIEFEQLAGDIAESAGLDRDVILRGLTDVADTLDRWAHCNEDPAGYAHDQEITVPPISLVEFREAECDVLAADACSDVEGLVARARPHLSVVGS
jgi:hypothetical protein